MWKKLLLFSVFTTIIVWFSSTNAATTSIDTQIEEELNKKSQQEMIKKSQDLNEKITFTKVNSCESMESVMNDFLETYKKLNPKPTRRRYDGPILYTNWMKSIWIDYAVNEMATDSSFEMESISDMWEITDFSTTNIQKIWVDEPEILKSNGKYLFYYSQVDYNDKYISIIKTPRQSNLSDAQIVWKIKIPNSLYDIQLFLNEDKLVILGSRSSSANNTVLWTSRSLAIIYDVSDLDNLKLEKLIEVYGSLEDARMIDDQIYLISSVNLNWYDIVWWDTTPSIKDYLPKMTELTLQTTNDTLKKIYKKNISSIGCNSIFYLLPSEETMKETWIYPNFTLISQISLKDLDSKSRQNLVFGNVDEIHMSQTSLYLPAPIYFSTPTRCSLRWCFGSRYYRDENTLIHKFNLEKTVKYQDSTIIPWTPLNQYSMDEDDDGNFRILTTTRYDQNATHLSILDKDLKLKWSLLNIEPGENFKSSRYIWDKLYLVTYQNIDPLFVVDMEDVSNPKIIGELKIPGYSTYLHPYSEARNGIQYLIWLWYSTKDNGYGWLTNDNTKVDLYKIDYKNHETAETKCSSLITKNVNPDFTDSCKKITLENKCNAEQRIYEDCLSKVNPENIAVSVIASHEFTGDSSSTPALYNPRVFVWRSNKQELILPIEIRNIIEEWNKSNNWNYKYDEFVGLKGLSIKSSTAMIEEILSQNFAKNDKSDSYYYRDFDDARVGYIDDIYYFLNKWFAAFLTKDGKIATIWAM